MGLFSKWFGKQPKKNKKERISRQETQKKTQPASQQKFSSDTQKIYHNFSDYGFPEINFRIHNNPMVDMIALIADLGRKLDEIKKPYEKAGFFYTELLDNDVFKAPFVFKWNDKNYAVYIIYTKEEMESFNTYKEMAEKVKYPNLLYISTLNPESVKTKSNVKPEFLLSDLSYVEEPQVKGQYGMWWNEEGDQHFHHSKTKEYLLEMYDAMKDYESYVFGILLKEINYKGLEKFQRVQLPENDQTFIVNGPENKQIAISVSKEKGIRFQFAKNTNRKYRENFLKHTAKYLKKLNKLLVSSNVQKDESNGENGSDWFHFLIRVLEKEEYQTKENGEVIIGLVNFD